MDEDLKVFEEKNERRKVKKSTKRKPLYKPPPVLTEYSPPKSSSRLSPEYRHQYPDSSSSIEIDQKVKRLWLWLKLWKNIFFLINNVKCIVIRKYLDKKNDVCSNFCLKLKTIGYAA